MLLYSLQPFEAFSPFVSVLQIFQSILVWLSMEEKKKERKKNHKTQVLYKNVWTQPG